MAMSDTLRAAAIAAVLLAGSCAAPTNDQPALVSDPDTNHPIVVDQQPQSLRLAFSSSNSGLTPQDTAQFDRFVSTYLSSSEGTINVTVPDGPASQQAIQYFGERLASAGVPRSRIMVGYRKDKDTRVELSYVNYAAHTDKCGNWSQDASDIGSNLPMPDFGCSVQNNIAAQVENPHDLIAPKVLGSGDATRRALVIGNYQKGIPTPATKNADQTVAVSDVKQQ